MRLHAWAWLALSSLPLFPVAGATRPRYGGTVTVELSSASTTTIAPLFEETLVRLNQRGEIEPLLATAWQRDPDRKRWRFSLRPKVLFHDGEPLNASHAAAALIAALKKKYGDVNVTAGGQTIVLQFDHAVSDLLTELANPRMAISRTSDKGTPIGTGPFRVSTWEPGRKIILAAFEDYWAGRPFLDSVIVSVGAMRAVGDIFEIPFSQTRRVLPEHIRTWESPVHELIALVDDNVQPVEWQALGLAIDRAPIVNVLAQRKAEAAFGLLPQWLSGYAFLFAAAPDVGRAKQLTSQLHLVPLALSYPSNDGFARSIAERVALNARDADIVLQPTPNPVGPLKIVRWTLESDDAATELNRIGVLLGLPERALNAARPQELYEAERAMLDAHRVIPILFLPDVYGIAPRVHNWDAAQKSGEFRLHLENVWVEP
jgi:ABC-type transport system substrate-binding protein